MSPSASVVTIEPVTSPVLMSGRSTVAEASGRALTGLMRTVTATGVTPPLPSSTVMVNVSVVSASVAPARAASCRAAAVGVNVKRPVGDTTRVPFSVLVGPE